MKIRNQNQNLNHPQMRVTIQMIMAREIKVTHLIWIWNIINNHVSVMGHWVGHVHNLFNLNLWTWFIVSPSTGCMLWTNKKKNNVYTRQDKVYVLSQFIISTSKIIHVYMKFWLYIQIYLNYVTIQLFFI